MKNNRKEFTRQFFRHNHLRFAGAVTVMLMNACINIAIAWLMQQLLDVSTGTPGRFSLAQLMVIFAGLLLFDVASDVLNYFTQPAFIRKAMSQYKNYAFERLSQKGIHSFSAESTSIYISALSNDTTSIENNYLCKILTLVKEIVLFAGALSLMLYYSPLLTLIGILLSALPVVASMLTGQRLARQEQQVSRQNNLFISTVKDMLSGFSIIKSFKAEREAFHLFSESSQAAESAKCHRRQTEQVIQAIGSFAGTITQFGVFFFGAWLALSGRGVTAGIVIAFVQLMNYIIMPIADVPQILANRKAAFALIDQLAAAITEHVRTTGKQISSQLQDAIECKHVSFAYEKDAPILQDLSVRFEAGKSYAIVGGSGSGKSTLLNLLMGSSEAYSGEICYDGEELHDIDAASLYDLVSIVQQNVFVFHSSIRDNITMFRDFAQPQLERAIRMSGMNRLIEAHGIDYDCGENGNALSGGERQRISIARCLLRGTPVMLVDEATAALDAETAFAVTNSILSLTELTRIIVTHRLEAALLQQYDGILVMKNGRIMETGSFAQLMEQKGYFYSLYTISQ